MSTHAGTAASQACVLCDGPCREPMRLPEIHDNYPFMSKEAIAMTKAQPEQTDAPEAPRRSKRLQATTAKQPAENRAHQPGENR